MYVVLEHGGKPTDFARKTGLFLLTAQNAVEYVLVRYIRTLKGDVFISSTAVVLGDFVRAVLCSQYLLLVALWSSEFRSITLRGIVHDIWEGRRMACVALINCIINNLQFIALSFLDAATFQVTYQSKMLMTALFSCLILKTKLTYQQWFSCFTLSVGIAMVQASSLDTTDTAAGTQVSIIGCLVTLLCAMVSSYNSVFSETTYKNSNKSLAVQNALLGYFGAGFSYVVVITMDGKIVSDRGFFHGYNNWAWLLIGFQAIRKIIITFVLKYAGSLKKGFSNSVAVSIGCVLAIIVFELNLTLQFVFGFLLVLWSCYIYRKYEIKTVNKLQSKGDSEKHVSQKEK